MEILPIGNSKIKISLTYNDLEKYSLSCDSLDYDTTEVRRAFWSILDDAKHFSGFDAAKSRILVQLFTSPSGGCEMFITQIPLKGDDDIICVKDPVSYVDSYVYAFDSFDSLLAACALLHNMGYAFESSAYRSDICYYLKVDCPEKIGEYHGCDISYPDLLCEFGKTVDNDFAKEYISEHCDILCATGAVARLAPLFNS